MSSLSRSSIEEDRVTVKRAAFSAPCSPVDDSQDNMATTNDPDDEDDAQSPTLMTSRSFIRRVKRRLSLRTSRRKDSRTSLSSLNLDLAFAQLRRKYGPVSRGDSPQLGEQTEHLYRELLRAVIHPLGATDHTVGLRPGDLVDHLKEVFDIERGEHEFFVRDVLANKPKHVQLNVSLEEAKLRHSDVTSVKDPYCILSVVNPYKNTRSPKSSPKNSPHVTRKKSSGASSRNSGDYGDVKQSQPGKGGPNPRWNESFEIEVGETTTDELHIYIWNNALLDTACGLDPQPPTNFNRTLSFRKSLFRQIRHMVDHDRTNTDFLGGVVMSIKDIPVMGCERWFDIVEKCTITGKPKNCGSLSLVLSLSVKQVDTCESCDNLSTPDTPCIDVYYQGVKQALRYTSNQGTNGGIIDGHVSEKSGKMLQLYAVSHRISKLSQSMMNLIVLLEWSVTNDAVTISDAALLKAIDTLHMTWSGMQVSAQSTLVQKMPLTDSEIVMFQKAVKQYSENAMGKLEHVIRLYPPSTEVVSSLEANLGIMIQLLQLDLWDDNTSPMRGLTATCTQRLQRDTALWVQSQLDDIAIGDDCIRDSVIPEMTAIIELITTVVSHCTHLGVVKQFFNNININYYKLTSSVVEGKVSRAAQSVIHELNKYQVRYHKYHVNINASSRLSLSLYFSLRKLFTAVVANSSHRDIFKLSIANYQAWFQEVLVFWLQTFKTECMYRMERALEIDKDVVLVTTMAKYSNSAVDVVSCFNIITEEWRQIEYNDADSVLMGVTKITDLICDGARLYADRVHSILERSCYYDDTYKHNRFDVTDQLCITLNNIEHVSRYMNELPGLLSWEAVNIAVTAKHGGDNNVGQQGLRTLYRLTKSAHRDILLKSTVLVKEITERMRENIFKYMEQFTRIHPEKLSSIDSVLDYMSTNTDTLTKRLVTSIYPVFMENLWFTVLVILDEQLMSGQTPEYYDTMKRHLRSLSMYFVRGGMEEERLTNSAVCSMIRERLLLNSQPTPDLILQYYSELADQCDTPVDYYGHVAIRVAYLEETRGNVTVYVKIMRANDLPGLDVGGLSDPYIIVTLQPAHLFDGAQTNRTHVVSKSLNPVFNRTFQFPNIAKSALSLPGAVIHVCVMDHDNFGSDDFAGEVFLHLNHMTAIEMDEHVDSLPVIIMPLKRPVNQAGPFQIMRERVHWDKLAKATVTERLKYIENRPERTDTPKETTSFMSSLTSRFRWFGLYREDDSDDYSLDKSTCIRKSTRKTAIIPVKHSDSSTTLDDDGTVKPEKKAWVWARVWTRKDNYVRDKLHNTERLYVKRGKNASKPKTDTNTPASAPVVTTKTSSEHQTFLPTWTSMTKTKSDFNMNTELNVSQPNVTHIPKSKSAISISTDTNDELLSPSNVNDKNFRLKSISKPELDSSGDFRHPNPASETVKGKHKRSSGDLKSETKKWVSSLAMCYSPQSCIVMGSGRDYGSCEDIDSVVKVVQASMGQSGDSYT